MGKNYLKLKIAKMRELDYPRLVYCAKNIHAAIQELTESHHGILQVSLVWGDIALWDITTLKRIL